MPEPQYDDDETVELPIGLVSPAGLSLSSPIGPDGTITTDNDALQYTGQAPPHGTEIARSASFGCEDTISVVRTVPLVSDDPGEAALEYLLSLDNVDHGNPRFSNPLALSSTLSVDQVQVNGSVAEVELSGEPVLRDSCDMWRVAMQIEVTVRAATGASSAQIMLNGMSIQEYWGLEEQGPLEITEIQRD